ncbi:unnamed protein product [Urochloa humidicola]
MATLSPPPNPSSPPPLPLHLDATTLPTSPMPVLSPSSAATSSSPHPTSRSLQDTAAGRNRSQRWSRDTPPSGKTGSGAPPLSFKEALLSTPPAALASPSPAPSISSPRTAPWILLQVSNSCPSPAKWAPDADGWRGEESRRSHKARWRADRGPRRRVLADLRGLCFNCFGPEHRVVACTNSTRCFRCHHLSHRALRYPNSDRPPCAAGPVTAGEWCAQDGLEL